MTLPYLRVSGTYDTAFMQAVLNGRTYSDDEWFDYIDAFHTVVPNANETLFDRLSSFDGASSYGILARAIAGRNGSNVLDVGCGNGYLIRELLDVLPAPARFSGIDLCAAEIAAARQDFAGEGRTAFERARAESLPFEDGAFDVVTSHQVFNFLPDPVPALREAYRVLRPGGTLAFVVNEAPKYFPDRVIQQLWLAALSVVLEHYPDCRLPHAYDERIYSEDGIRELLSLATEEAVGNVTVRPFEVGAALLPQEAAAMIGRFYVISSHPYVDEVYGAVESFAQYLATEKRTDRVLFEVPFRLVELQKPPIVTAR